MKLLIFTAVPFIVMAPATVIILWLHIVSNSTLSGRNLFSKINSGFIGMDLLRTPG